MGFFLGRREGAGFVGNRYSRAEQPAAQKAVRHEHRKSAAHRTSCTPTTLVPRPRPPPSCPASPPWHRQAAPLQSDIHALRPLETQRCCNRPVRGRRWMGHSAMHFQVPYPCPHSFMCTKLMIIRALSDSDIAVRRKAAFLLNSLLIASAPAAMTRARNKITGWPRTVRSNRASQFPCAVRAHGLLPVIVREPTEPTPSSYDHFCFLHHICSLVFPTSTCAWSSLRQRAGCAIRSQRLCTEHSNYRDAPPTRRPAPRPVTPVLQS